MNTNQSTHDAHAANIVRLMADLQVAIDSYIQYQNTPEAWVFDSADGIAESMVVFMNEKAKKECQYKKVGGMSAVAHRIIVNGVQKYISANVLFYISDDDTLRNYAISASTLVVSDHL
jgi:hypothetical protein